MNKVLTLWANNMADSIIPPAVKAKVKQTADSSTLNWIYRGGMIVACGMIVYFSKGTYETVQSHNTEIAHISDTTDSLKVDIAKVKDQDGADHDAVTTLKVQMASVIDQIAKLWSRPAPKADKEPQ